MFREDLRERREDFWVLRDINFRVEQGEAVALLGANGSGKSTLLKLIAMTMPPTEGGIVTHGRVVPMIELGLGFHPELNGKQNIYLNASLFGLSKGQVDRIYERIVDFAELGSFIDIPLKNYSSGMHARLAFSTAIHLDPDVLLVDEVLAVGDERFQEKCMSRIREYLGLGKTLLFVSHSATQVARICRRGFLLDHGRITATGNVKDVLASYQRPSI